MKISIIANGFQEDYTINLINALADAGHEIDFIGSNIYPVEKINDNIRFYQVRKEDPNEKSSFKKAIWVTRYFLWYLGYLIREKHNIIHIQWLRFNFADGVFFPLAARLFGHRVVYTAHDVVPHDEDTKYNRFIFKMVYRAQNSIIVHTNYIRNRIIKEFKIREDKVTVIKHGIYKLDQALKVDPEAYKKELGLDPDEYLILFFGFLTRYKGLDLLAECLEDIRKESGHKVRLIVAGRVQNGFEHEMNQMKANKLSRGVDFYLRFIEDREVQMLFGAADLTALPYREASQSGVMFMSYTHGVPVVAPRLGGFPDDVVEGKTGLLFETNNIESLKEKILTAISTWGANNSTLKQYIVNHTSKIYQWENSAAELLKIYKQIIGNKN